ncbi:MAG: hypothetical protein J2P18_21915 [Nocardia sp.]|nr:hypothetical protein [Nocardia sp.]
MTNPQGPQGYEQPWIPSGGPLGANWKDGELHNAFQSLTVDHTYDQARQYETAANLWNEGVETFQQEITRSISDAWEGVSAEAAKKAIGDYTHAAQQLTDPLQQLTNHMVSSAEAVVNAKHSIPEGVHIDATSWLWPPHRFDLEERQGQHRQEGWEKYKELYVKPLGQVDATIPVLSEASNPTHSAGFVPGGSGPGAGSVTGGPGGPGGAHPGGGIPGAGPGGHEDGDSGHPKPGDPDGTKPGAENPAAQGNPSSQPTSPSAPHLNAVQPAGVDPSKLGAATTPSGLSDGASSPGSSGGGLGSPGGIGGIHGPGSDSGSGSRSGGPGRSLPGTGKPGGAMNPAASTGRTAGAAGLPGMGIPGANTKRAQDREHKTPDYLTTAENAEELIGELPKTLPGGVIGAEYTAAESPAADDRQDERPDER